MLMIYCYWLGTVNVIVKCMVAFIFIALLLIIDDIALPILNFESKYDWP